MNRETIRIYNKNQFWLKGKMFEIKTEHVLLMAGLQGHQALLYVSTDKIKYWLVRNLVHFLSIIN